MSPAADRPPLRDRILAGALQVVREKGVVAATTKEIARAAGVSEGSLYNHFANKTELIGAVMTEVTAGVRAALAVLHQRVGQATVEDNLATFAATAVEFFTDLLPIVGQVIGDHDMLGWLRQAPPGTAGTGPAAGPVMGLTALAGYLARERDAGRLSPTARPAYLAAALLGGCQQYAFLRLLAGPDTVTARTDLSPDPAAYARELVTTLLGGSING
jgi:AcrR family transcriptional regulator